MNYRTKEERQLEIKPIIIKLRELNLTTQSHMEIKELYIKMQSYINNCVRIELDIPFPSYNCCIKGILSINKREKLWVKLETNK